MVVISRIFSRTGTGYGKLQAARILREFSSDNYDLIMIDRIVFLYINILLYMNLLFNDCLFIKIITNM